MSILSAVSSVSPFSAALHIGEVASHFLHKSDATQGGQGGQGGQDDGGGMEKALFKSMQHVLSTAAKPA